ncbi:hypothetical protein [Sporomusa acidovorans]|nr:hypothetical protein [Sporomusa acidovorans]
MPVVTLRHHPPAPDGRIPGDDAQGLGRGTIRHREVKTRSRH